MGTLSSKVRENQNYALSSTRVDRFNIASVFNVLKAKLRMSGLNIATDLLHWF